MYKFLHCTHPFPYLPGPKYEMLFWRELPVMEGINVTKVDDALKKMMSMAEMHVPFQCPQSGRDG